MKVFLQTSTRVQSLSKVSEEADARSQAVNVLKALGKKFHSYAFAQLASRARTDPFGKVTERASRL